MNWKDPKINFIFSRLGFDKKLEWLEISPYSNSSIYQELIEQLLEIDDYKTLKEGIGYQLLMKEDSKEDDRVRNQDRWGSFMNDWLYSMVDDDNPLREKVALFWHHQIPCGVGHKFEHAQLLLEIYRKYGMGDLSALLIEIAANPAMMYHLDGHWSHKDNPNENFSRELLELFTLGYGNYTEMDVKEASRAFTGRRFDHVNYPYKMFVDKSAYDDGEKVFLGEVGNWNGEDIIKILKKKKAVAHYIATSAYRFFVGDKIEKDVVGHCADAYFKSGFQFKTLLKQLILSSLEWIDRSETTKVKTPVELLVGFQRLTGCRAKGIKTSLHFLRSCGQDLFNPPSVAGWPSGEAMLKGEQAIYRMFLPSLMLQIANRTLSRDSLIYKIKSRLIDADYISYRYISDALFDFHKFENVLKKENISPSEWLFYKNGDETDVVKLLSSPSFQYC